MKRSGPCSLPLLGWRRFRFRSLPGQAPPEEFRIVFPSLSNDTLDPILTGGAGTLGLAAIYDDLVGAKAG